MKRPYRITIESPREKHTQVSRWDGGAAVVSVQVTPEDTGVPGAVALRGGRTGLIICLASILHSFLEEIGPDSVEEACELAPKIYSRTIDHNAEKQG